MARGAQKLQSQQKNAAKKAKLNKKNAPKKKEGRTESTMCQICRTQFNQISKSTIKLNEHHEAKHKKLTFAQCFPDYTPEAIAKRLADMDLAKNTKPKYKPDKAPAEKKKKYKRKGV